MATLTLTLGAWSSDIGATTYDTVVQCTKGAVFVNWEASAPTDKTDGFYLVAGESIVVPAGNTYRVAPAPHIQALGDVKVNYQEFAA